MASDPYKATYRTLNQVARGLILFKLDTGRWPISLSDLIAKPDWVKEGSYQTGGYLKDLPVDGWGRAIEYRRLADSDEQYNLISHGPHGDFPDHDLDIIHHFGTPLM